MRPIQPDVYDPAETQPPEQRRAAQEQALRRILRQAAAHAPAVRAALQAAGCDPDTITLEDLGRLPVLPKEGLPARQATSPPFGGWLGAPPEQVRRIFASPGPIYEPEGHRPDYWGFAPALYAGGFRRGDVVVNTFSYHLTPAGAMFDGALLSLGCIVVPTGVGHLDIQVRTLQDLRAAGFIGTPSFLAAVLEHLEQSGGRSPLRRAFVSGEPLPESLRATLESRHGLRISQGYAIADLGLVAYECDRRAGLHLADRVVVELVDPSTGTAVADGEAGEVVVTFLEPLYPLLRLGTGDLARLAPGGCPCGRTAARLERILGRVGEAVKVRGIFLHPRELEAAVRRHPQIGRYQAVVSRRDHQDELTVRVEAEGAAADLAAAVARSIYEVTRLRAAVEVVSPGTLGPDDARILDRRRWD
ncbi:MAG: AMP-binding protein [Armatimonadota bacterium]|nr:AMP-binding protein [Armatimonadota bacterium]MDR7437854.1 AMP-binding protein [Armatimonadota bacterium]MDR7472114.1 AMP-binding protein [Armatimonadota bacterium]MDR7583190.1 AMP-binding protein [Armatimonadota bacterium]